MLTDITRWNFHKFWQFPDLFNLRTFNSYFIFKSKKGRDKFVRKLFRSLQFKNPWSYFIRKSKRGESVGLFQITSDTYIAVLKVRI